MCLLIAVAGPLWWCLFPFSLIVLVVLTLDGVVVLVLSIVPFLTLVVVVVLVLCQH